MEVTNPLTGSLKSRRTKRANYAIHTDEVSPDFAVWFNLETGKTPDEFLAHPEHKVKRYTSKKRLNAFSTLYAHDVDSMIKYQKHVHKLREQHQRKPQN